MILDRLFLKCGFSKCLPTLYAAHCKCTSPGLQRSKELDRGETWIPLTGTQSSLAQPHSQASLPLSHFLFKAKVVLCSQAQKWAFFFIINKTLSNAHSYKCFTLFAYSIRVINPKDRCQCNCWILQINLAAIKATNLSNGTVSQSQAVNWCEHRFKTDKDIYKNINQFGRQSQRYC